MRLLVLLVVAAAAAAVRGGQLCPEYPAFLRANDLRCQRPGPACTSDAECQFEPSDVCYVGACVQGQCQFGYNETCVEGQPQQQLLAAARLGPANFHALAVNNTAQCHGYNNETEQCFTGLCHQGACVELLQRPVENVFECDCEAARYLECFSDADCEILVAERPPEQQSCVSARCNSLGFCDLRTPPAPVPQGCCVSDDDCDDGNPCTVDSCQQDGSGQCVHAVNNQTEGCCGETRDCQGVPLNQPQCPESVCEQGSCLVALAAPVCVGEETCQADRFSYCAVETTVLVGEVGTLTCQGDTQLLPGRSCVMRYPDNMCSYGTCAQGGVPICEPQAELNNTLFPCDCACGPRIIEQLVCGDPGTEFAQQCVPLGQGGGGGGSGGDTDVERKLSTAFFWFAVALFPFIGLCLIIFYAVRACERRKGQRPSKRA